MKLFLRLLIAVLLLAFPVQGFTQSFGQLNLTPPDDTAYDATTWNANKRSATKNVLRDKIESILSDQNQSNIYYVGKHGADTNTGEAMGDALLTFGVAITEASSGDVVVCLDAGVYTENLTGASGIDIFAPNATIAGAHTIATSNSWVFGTATVATDTIGFTMNTVSQKAYLEVGVILISAYTSQLTAGVVSIAGKLYGHFGLIQVGANAYGIGSTTTDEVYANFNEIVLAAGATAVGVAASGDVNIEGACVEDGGGSGVLVYSTDVSSSISMHIVKVEVEVLSNIGATPDVSLVVSNLSGSLAENGAGKVTIGGAVKIEGIPIGAVTPDTGKFTTVDSGQGAYEIYAMDQDVESTDSPSFHQKIVTIGENTVLSVAQCLNTLVIVTGAWTVTLPDVSGYTGSVGGSCAILATTAAVFHVDTYVTDLMSLYGTDLNDGDKATSPGTKGAMIVFVNTTSTGWEALRGEGIFVDGG